MKALLWFIALGLVVANVAAFLAGTRSGLGGMITVDVLAVLTMGAVGTIWYARRLARPVALRAARAAERADDLAVDIAAQGLKAGRKISSAAKTFADRVRERAGRNAT